MKREISELYDELLLLYTTACKNGVCTNQQNFARYIGVTTNTISKAFQKNPQNLTESLINKARKCLIENGILKQPPVQIGDNSIMQSQSPAAHIGISEEKHTEIISNLLRELAEQRASYERIIVAICGKTDK